MLANANHSLQQEDLLKISEGHRLPTKPSASAVRQWCEFGRRRTLDGQKIRLESIKIGGYRYTSMEAYYRWIDALNEGTE